MMTNRCVLVLLIFMALYGRIKANSDGYVCERFVGVYFGQFDFSTESDSNQQSPNTSLLFLPTQHKLFANVEFSIDGSKIRANLVKKKLDDQQYLVRLTVSNGITDPIPEFKKCEGFWRDGHDECAINIIDNIVDFTFELCTSQEKCETLFYANVVGSNKYLYPPTYASEHGSPWADLQCTNAIKFKESTQPPKMNYCVCCNSDTSGASECPIDKEWTDMTTDIDTTSQVITSTMHEKWQTDTTQPTMHTTTDISTPLDNCLYPTGLQIYYCDNTTLTNSTVGEAIQNVTDSLDVKKADWKDVYWLSHIFVKISNVEGISVEDSEQLYHLYDKTLQIQEQPFYEINTKVDPSTSNRIIQSVSTFLTNSQFDLELLDKQSLAMLKYNDLEDCSNKQFIGLSDNGNSFGKTAGSEDQVASIEVPNDVACLNGQKISTFFVAYRKTQLFLPIDTKNKKDKKSRFEAVLDNPEGSEEQHQPAVDRCKVGLYSEHHPVLSATVIHDLKPVKRIGKKVMARLKYSANNVKRALHGWHTVSWWSMSEDNWSINDQCTTKLVNGFYEAQCMHLTDFTLLVDGSPTDPILCNPILIILGSVLVIGSALGLLCIMIIQGLNLSKTLRLHAATFFTKFPSFRFRVELISFVYTTVLFCSTRSLGSSPIRPELQVNVCIILTIFQSWRILKLFAWSSGMENMFTFLTRNSVTFALTIAIPSLISVVGFLIDPELYKRGDDFCWINPTDISWAIIVPMSILISNGVICMVIITIRLFPNAGCMRTCFRFVRMNSNVLTRGKKNKSRDKFLAILNMQFLLGVPWALQYLTLFSRQATMWHYLFTVVNGSQGIILFILFVYRRIRTHQNLATTTRSSDGSDDTQPRTAITDTRNENTDSANESVKKRHPPLMTIASLPNRLGRVYENNEYEYPELQQPIIPIRPPLSQLPRVEYPNVNTRFSRQPQREGANIPSLARNMYLY